MTNFYSESVDNSKLMSNINLENLNIASDNRDLEKAYLMYQKEGLIDVNQNSITKLVNNSHDT